VNKVSLNLYQATHKEQLLGNLSAEMLRESEAVNRELLIAIAEGNTRFEGELINYTLNGERLHIALSWLVAPGHESTLSKVIVSIIDITERKRAEEARRESEERFRQLAENMHQAIWLRDIETNATLYMNPAYPNVFGDTRDNLFAGSERFRAIVHPDDQADVEADRAAHRFGGSDHENRVIRADGSVRWLRVRTFPVHDAQGNPYRVVGMAEDITERKQAEAQQAELVAERARMKVVEQFAQNAAHDLRTPLTIMQTSAFLLAKSDEPEKKQRHLQNLEEQIAHITRVLQDFLDLSRLDQQTLELEPEPCDVRVLVNTIREEQQPLAERKQHHVQLDLAPDLPSVLGDKTALQRAFRNLIVNALNYTPDGGDITVAAFQHDQQVVVEVRDNGIGISESELPYIFERFYRADKARNTDTGSSGLGLTIARKIVEAHHGSIEVESSPGQGSTFRVLLPIQGA
jgi:PAS domain S-box-containing protein